MSAALHRRRIEDPGADCYRQPRTILLDEVDSLPLSVQAKLLRFLQQKNTVAWVRVK